MDERQWLACADPDALVAYLLASGAWARGPAGARGRRRALSRQLRLFACACVRRAWHLVLDEGVREMVRVAERLADGLAGQPDVYAAWSRSSRSSRRGATRFWWRPGTIGSRGRA